MADFLEALVAFDRDRGWEEVGYTGLFRFLHRESKLSKGRRTTAHRPPRS